jgi:hypothetical protein
MPDDDDWLPPGWLVPEQEEDVKLSPTLSHETEEDIEFFRPAPEVLLETLAPEDIDAQRHALLQKFPKAHRRYLERVLAGPKAIVWALLKPKVDDRIDELLHLLLCQEGLSTSDQRSQTKGHGVDWSGLSDTGLLFYKTPNKHVGGFVYELRLDSFDSSRGSRDALSQADRLRLFASYGNRCNALGCGSSKDLQADHRIGVVVAGGSNGQLDAFQPLCRPCNLNKRVACGKCKPDSAVKCTGCSWASPENHTHTAGEPGIRVTFRLVPGSYQKAASLLKEHGVLFVGEL